MGAVPSGWSSRVWRRPVDRQDGSGEGFTARQGLNLYGPTAPRRNRAMSLEYARPVRGKRPCSRSPENTKRCADKQSSRV